MARRISRIASRSMLLFGGAVLAAAALAACSGVPGSPQGVAKKMLRAYGGPARVERLQSYVGKGFIKDLSSQLVAKSLIFDVYRKGPLYKQTIKAVSGGQLVGAAVYYYDGKSYHEWRDGKDTRTIRSAEAGILRYRFPTVIQWIQGADVPCEKLPVEKGENVVRLRCKEGASEVTLVIDTKTWLLNGIEFASTSDSAFTFTEAYTHYTDIDGIPFPQTFRGEYNGRLYYEYTLAAVELKSDLDDSVFGVTVEDSLGVAKGAAKAALAH